MNDNRFNGWGRLSKVTVGKSSFTFTLDDFDCNNILLIWSVLDERVGISWLGGEGKQVDINVVKEEADDSEQT